MILFFADRQLNILGQASTILPDGLTINDDWKTEDIETGVATFECYVPYDANTRAKVEACTDVGNYILRSYNGENEFYTIIESEINTENQEAYIYAEDAGLDLLNEIVGEYEADKAYPISHYINKFAYDSGFVIGTNEAASLTRQLSWSGESTAAERIASIAAQFGGCEVSYSFDIKGLEVTNKYINIHKQRGKDVGAQLRLNYDIDSIVTQKSIMNLATALQCVGGTPDDENLDDDIEPQPITLSGYKYDDGNFYVSGTQLRSREALKKWGRYSWAKEPNQTTAGGHIVKSFSSDTTSQAELCSQAIAELKKLCEIEVNYKVEIAKLPENVRIGDTVNIIDDAGELYLSARILKLETSETKQQHKATLGEYLIKSSGISQKVADLAAQFAAAAASAARALSVAQNAQIAAVEVEKDIVTVRSDLNQTIAEEKEAAIETSSQMINDALESYVEATVYAADQEMMLSEIEVVENDVQTNNDALAEQIDALSDDTKAQLEKIFKHISFTDKGIVISSGGDSFTLQLDNDEGIKFSKNGVDLSKWLGSDFYAGNIVIETNERAQFGNFAYIPRSDGSLSFLKVGG